MSSSSDFHVVLVPGAWHIASGYDTLLPYLDAAGYSHTALTLPSVDAEQAIPDTAADIAHIRSHLLALLSTTPSKKIILVLHSYGGMPGTDACKDLSFTERKSQNLPGGVFGLVYLAACLVLPGESVFTINSLIPPSPGSTKDPLAHIDIDPSTGRAKVKNPIPEFYDDLTSEQQTKLVAQLGTQSMGVFTSPLSYPAYVDIPACYLLCTDDKTLKPKLQELMVKRVKDFGGNIELSKVDSAHTVFVRRPETVVALVEQAAGRAAAGGA